MPAGTRTFGLDETFIEPRVLPPPPTRHALLVFLIALTSILHIGTAGWSEIHNGAEGYFASGAREMVRTGSWIPAQRDESPLVYWMLAASYQLFGINATAARLPIAFATMASIAFTFLIGERLGGYWRGFVAGLVHLCCLGSFVWGRLVTPEPIFAAFIGAAIFSAVRGYQHQRGRRLWFAAVWTCAALACLAKGAISFVYLGAIFLLLAVSYREARMRFRWLLHWHYFVIFLPLILLWFFLTQAPSISLIEPEDVPLPRFLFVHLAWWFPALMLVLPGLIFATRKVFRPHEFDFADALPLYWMAVGFLPLIVLSGRQDYQSLSMWSAVALVAASVWDRTPRALRIAGIALAATVGLAASWWAAFGGVRPGSAVSWSTSPAALMLIGFAVVLSAVVGGYFAWRHREELAITTVLLGMIPVGLGAAEGMARYGSHFSLASAGQFLRPLLGDDGQVFYEGSHLAGSSLPFYLERPPVYVGTPDSAATLEAMSQPHPVYLIIRKDRMPFWQEQLTERFHIYHQVTTCGDHVVINNHE